MTPSDKQETCLFLYKDVIADHTESPWGLGTGQIFEAFRRDSTLLVAFKAAVPYGRKAVVHFHPWKGNENISQECQTGIGYSPQNNEERHLYIG